MSSNINWTQASIQQVNNYLIIMGDQLLKSGRGMDSVYRACYALPSNPNEMDAWCDEWLNQESQKSLFEFIRDK
ncbi:MAG: hypothetical protein PVG66_06990 [Chromatiales bacterium]|jgi:hypothetical protein